MPVELDLISPTDKPALLAISHADSLGACKGVLNELGYKVHVAQDHNDFISRFSRIPYQITIIDENFCGSAPPENASLQAVQWMPMNQRRHSAVLLLGDSVQTLNVMQAFQQSVHAVIHRRDLSSLAQVVQQVVADTNLFFNVYREVQLRMTQGKA